MNCSTTLAKFAAAFVKAQAELKSVGFDANNPYFHSQYATLGAIIDAARPILAKYDLGVIQFPCNADGGRLGVETVIIHGSGEWMGGMFTLTTAQVDKAGSPKIATAQNEASSITYCKRYGWAAALGMYADSDDDGAVSSGTVAAAAPARVATAAPSAPATKEPLAPSDIRHIASCVPGDKFPSIFGKVVDITPTKTGKATGYKMDVSPGVTVTVFLFAKPAKDVEKGDTAELVGVYASEYDKKDSAGKPTGQKAMSWAMAGIVPASKNARTTAAPAVTGAASDADDPLPF